MVLTNFECWAQGGGNFESVGLNAVVRQLDLFNPRLVQHAMEKANPNTVSHMSSNGYYGYSCVSVPKTNNDIEMTTDGNDMLNYNTVAGAVRCKKRCFVTDKNLSTIHADQVGVIDAATAAKRGCFNNIYNRQYNGFSESSMQRRTGTNAELFMDVEEICNESHQHEEQLQPYHDKQKQQEHRQQRQQSQLQDIRYKQAYDSMFMLQPTFTNSSSHLLHLLKSPQAQPQELYQDHNQNKLEKCKVNTPLQMVQQQQQIFQGHLHRANRDVSRCVMSHMI